MGDFLQKASGVAARVEGVQRVTEQGLYNPQTLAGEIVVDGFQASTYTTHVEPVFAEALLAPIRAAFRFTGIDITMGTLESGAPEFVLRRIPTVV